MENTILIVDDEKEIAELLEIYLKNEGFLVRSFPDAQSTLAYLEENTADLAVLDRMLPDTDGLTLCRKIRETHRFPVIMLTAKSEDLDKITGLAAGADDYMTKPFNPLELLARIKAQLRRCRMYDASPRTSDELRNEYDIRGLVINKDSHKCFLFGEEIALTPIEFAILWDLCSHRGSVVSSEELFERVWKEKYLDNSNTVVAHIGRLREKLREPARKPRWIKTIWGIGYEIE